MPTLTIDNIVIPFEPGETILQVAGRANIAIPTLCHWEGIEPPTSCYVCVVKIQGKNGMQPSCATLAEEGMILESNSDEVRRYRKLALELLLSEHAGDCEGPCRRICPADLDIPVMARQIASGDLGAALRTVRERLALPGVLGYVCPAPCQKGCLRAPLDGPVTIRDLHRSVAEAALASGSVITPRVAPATGKKVTIIGAGPAGLSSAYYLSLLGHACTVVDEREAPGGMLRYGIDRARLPLTILDHEIELIRALGVEFKMGCSIRDQQALDELTQRSDAIIFATGMLPPGQPWPFTIAATPKGITVDTHTFTSNTSGIFACGGAIAVCKMAVRAVGQGRLTAESVHRFLTQSVGTTAWSPRFDSHLGKPTPEELEQLASTDLAHSLNRWAPTASNDGLHEGETFLASNDTNHANEENKARWSDSVNHSANAESVAVIRQSRNKARWSDSGNHSANAESEAVIFNEGTGKSASIQSSLIAAAARCMQCDCGKKHTCALRAYSQEYEAHHDPHRTGARKPVTRQRYASGLVHEPGKCIDCGRCIGITAAEHVQPGLAFGNRGFDVAVKAPFNAEMDTAMGTTLERCIAACPVGALWKENGTDGGENGTYGTNATNGTYVSAHVPHTSPMSHPPIGGAL